MSRAQMLLPATLAGVMFAATSLAAPQVDNEIIDRGWQPPVSLAGEGDPLTAVTRMRAYADLRDTLIHHTHYHAETRDFMDALRRSLERFDLRGFYGMLPEEQGEDRLIRVEGVMEHGRYRVRPMPGQGRGALTAHGNRPLPMGDMEARVQAREIDARRGRHYLLSGDLRVGVGEMRWPAVVEASRNLLRLMVEGEPEFDTGPNAGYYRERVRATNPQLAEHEIDVLAPLWAAYPAIAEVLSGIGQIESLLVRGAPGDRDRPVEAAAHIDPERLAANYPALRRYLDRLGPIMSLDAVVHDEYGQVVAVTVDSRTQRATLSMLVRDGQPVATLNGKAVPEARPLLDDTERRLNADVAVRVELLGIVADVTGMQGYIHYRPDGDNARVTGQMVHTPTVRTSGRALGVMPAGMINFVLPRSIDQLATDFMSVATQGNSGRGITGEVNFRQNPKGEAEVNAAGAFEALDNFMVRLGMRMVSDRVIPDPDTADDLGRLIGDIQAAFVEDLDLFEARVVAQHP
ncbi:hypothetical protein [Isoalcanivorax indicus]|uniref:hypothetical protein n=1 Tax=Isoalcanivorax indicus TaxID=2202653 RepID=UPI000DB96102|nr:hypothetical protein [Isoalcanivorax indicus]